MMLVKGGAVDKFIMSHTDRKLIQGIGRYILSGCKDEHPLCML